MVRLTQGSPPDLTLKAAINVRKPNPTKEIPKRVGEGGRFMDSTDDSGPVKPGNGVEEKTLTTRKEAWMYQQRRWGMGSRGREVMVTPMRSRHSVTGERWSQKTEGGYPNSIIGMPTR